MWNCVFCHCNVLSNFSSAAAYNHKSLCDSWEKSIRNEISSHSPSAYVIVLIIK